MHGLVTHLTAGDGDVLERRQRRSASGHLDELDVADPAGGHHATQFRVVAVEATVEVDHRDDALVVRVLDDRRGLAVVQVDGLLAQHGKACPSSAAKVACVGVGGRRDEHRVDGGWVEDVVQRRRDAGVVLAGNGFGPRLVDVVDIREVDFWMRGEVLRVHAADEPGADQGKALHHATAVDSAPAGTTQLPLSACDAAAASTNCTPIRPSMPVGMDSSRLGGGVPSRLARRCSPRSV